MPTSPAEALAEARALEGPLSVRLAHYADSMRALASPFAPVYDRLVARLIAGEVGAAAPAVGSPLPGFVLPAHTGELVQSNELFQRGPTVVSFNRGHWCPFCRLEVAALAAASARIAALGGQVVSITPEPAAQQRRLQQDAKAPFLFLSDADNGYALTLGLGMRIDDELRTLMQSRGMDLEAYQGSDTWMLPVPATFVVDRQGVVRGRFVDPDFRRRAEIDDILAVLRSIAGGP